MPLTTRARTDRSDALSVPGGPAVVATGDHALRDHAVRWCAAIGSTPEVVSDLVGLRLRWRAAPAVLLGIDLATQLLPGDLARRDQVVLVAHDPDAAWRHAVTVGAAGVAVAADEPAAVRTVAAALDGRHEGCLIAVIGATGGAGASAFSATLALAGAGRGLASVVIDADPLAGGLDLLLGAERGEGARWEDLDHGGGPWGAESLRRALPRAGGVSVLTWRREPTGEKTAAIDDVTSTTVRGFDLVVVDLPRHRCRDASGVLARAVLTVLVVPDDVRSVAAARSLAERLQGVAGDLAVVVARRPGGAGPAAVADVVGRPAVGVLRTGRRMRAALERGDGPHRWRSGRRAAASVLDLLGLEAARVQGRSR